MNDVSRLTPTGQHHALPPAVPSHIPVQRFEQLIAQNTPEDLQGLQDRLNDKLILLDMNRQTLEQGTVNTDAGQVPISALLAGLDNETDILQRLITAANMILDERRAALLQPPEPLPPAVKPVSMFESAELQAGELYEFNVAEIGSKHVALDLVFESLDKWMEISGGYGSTYHLQFLDADGKVIHLAPVLDTAQADTTASNIFSNSSDQISVYWHGEQFSVDGEDNQNRGTTFTINGYGVEQVANQNLGRNMPVVMIETDTGPQRLPLHQIDFAAIRVSNESNQLHVLPTAADVATAKAALQNPENLTLAELLQYTQPSLERASPELGIKASQATTPRNINQIIINAYAGAQSEAEISRVHEQLSLLIQTNPHSFEGIERTDGYVDTVISRTRWLQRVRLDLTDRAADRQFDDLSFDENLHVDLRKADLSELDLSDISWKGVNLSTANLNGTNLQGATLEQLNLTAANMQKTNLVNANLNHVNFDGANLSGAQLSGIDFFGNNLDRANLSHANLSDAKFANLLFTQTYMPWANLSGADFSQAWLNGVSLMGANLSEADLSKARLSTVNLTTAQLRNATLDELHIHGHIITDSITAETNVKFNELLLARNHTAGFPSETIKLEHIKEILSARAPERNFGQLSLDENGYVDLRGMDLSNLDLSGMVLFDLNLEGANLSGTNLDNSSLLDSILTNTNMQKVDLRNTQLGTLILDNADLSGANLSGIKLHQFSLNGTLFYQADLSSADLTKVRFSNNNMQGANLSGANLKLARLSSVNLEAANMSKTNLEHTIFDDVNLQGTDLRRAFLDKTQMSDVNLAKAQLGYAFFFNPIFENVNVDQSAANSSQNFKALLKTLKIDIQPTQIASSDPSIEPSSSTITDNPSTDSGPLNPGQHSITPSDPDTPNSQQNSPQNGLGRFTISNILNPFNNPNGIIGNNGSQAGHGDGNNNNGTITAVAGDPQEPNNPFQVINGEVVVGDKVLLPELDLSGGAAQPGETVFGIPVGLNDLPETTATTRTEPATNTPIVDTTAKNASPTSQQGSVTIGGQLGSKPEAEKANSKMEQLLGKGWRQGLRPDLPPTTIDSRIPGFGEGVPPADVGSNDTRWGLPDDPITLPESEGFPEKDPVLDEILNPNGVGRPQFTFPPIKEGSRIPEVPAEAQAALTKALPELQGIRYAQFSQLSTADQQQVLPRTLAYQQLAPNDKTNISLIEYLDSRKTSEPQRQQLSRVDAAQTVQQAQLNTVEARTGLDSSTIDLINARINALQANTGQINQQTQSIQQSNAQRINALATQAQTDPVGVAFIKPEAPQSTPENRPEIKAPVSQDSAPIPRFMVVRTENGPKLIENLANGQSQLHAYPLSADTPITRQEPNGAWSGVPDVGQIGSRLFLDLLFTNGALKMVNNGNPVQAPNSGTPQQPPVNGTPQTPTGIPQPGF